MALLNQTTRGATVRCTEPMNTLSLSKREFSVLASSLPELRKNFNQVMEQRTKANSESAISNKVA
jgi:hypothetical protein